VPFGFREAVALDAILMACEKELPSVVLFAIAPYFYRIAE